MKIEIDTETFDFAYENKSFLKMVNYYSALLNGINDSLDGKILIEESRKESVLNEFRTRAFTYYHGLKV